MSIAIREGDRELTYGELLGRADGLAGWLRERGVGPDDRVAVLYGRSIDYVVAALGVLRAGACYVPVDPEYPAQRREFLLADAGARLVVDRAVVGNAAAATGSAPSERDLAYVIYTSGSTGRPKGVAVEHRSLSHLISWHHKAFGTGPGDRALLLAGVGFDASAWELWANLTAGATLVIPDEATKRDPERLRDLIVAERITQTFAPTLLAEALVALPWPEHTALRVLNTGGDRLRARPPAGLPFVLVNNYGPTETAVVATSGRVDPGKGVPTIGRPISGTTIHLRDGELFLGGAGVARGYLGRPDLTAQRFVDDPDAGRLYRTGDLVRLRADGELEFAGRVDDQVQIRGHRVEPGEVEAILATCPGVRSGTVIADEDAAGAACLAAFYTGDAAPASVRRWLAGRLPAPLVPAHVRRIPELPVTANGKLDRAALRSRLSADRPLGALPGTPAETLLADIWSEVLGFRVGVDETFTELGGHSLAAARIATRIAERFGQRVPPASYFDGLTIADLAARLGAPVAAAEPVAAVPDGALTAAQTRYWFLDQVTPDRALHNVSVGFDLDGVVDEAALAGALAAIVDRHPALRTAIVETPDGPRQRVVETEPFAVPVHDLRAEPDAAAVILDGLAARPFDLSRPPLIRAALVRVGQRAWRLGLTVHHIAFDGASLDVLLREVAELYSALVAGRDLPAARRRPTPSEVAAWERSQSADPESVDYWTSALRDAPAVLDFPVAHPRPAMPSCRGAAVTRRHTIGFERIAARADVTPFMVAMTALLGVLHRYTGQTDLVVGTPASDRGRPDFEDLIGCFVNTLALRVDLAGQPTFGEALDRVRRVALDGYAHRRLPFDRLVEAVGRAGERGHHPLFQVMLVMQEPQVTEVPLPGATLRYTGELFAPRARFDLTFVFDRDTVTLEYATDLFSPAIAERLLDHLLLMLEAESLEPDLLPANELRQVLAWGDGGPAHRPGPVHRRLAGPPDRTAVVCDGETLTYHELDRYANGLAWALREHGIEAEEPVAVCLPRSVDSVLAMIAVHRAGGAYVPLDPAYPDERLRIVLDDVGARVVICPRAWAGRLRGLGRPELSIVEPARSARDEPPPAEVAEDGLADIMFTSGSTGRPKGVLLTHGSLANLVAAKVDRFDVRPDSRVLQFVSFGFSVSISDVYMTLTAGATLIMRGDTELSGADLADLVRRHGVTDVVLPASVLAAMPDADLPSLRAIAVGGEACSAALVDRWAPGRRFVNAYGPTEATTAAATGVCVPGERPTIGRPIAGARIYVLDRHGRPVPAGVPGELYIGGAGVGRGYLNRPELTAERFQADLFAGGRMYRTGDLALWLPDGRIALLGRNDDQVNVRGARVEIGDVEAALRAHPSIVDAAVTVHRHPVAGEQLVGYLVGGVPEPAELRGFLRERLPGHAVPTAFVTVPALPRTTTGKVDRRALPPPAEGAGPHRRAPQGPIEEILVEIWAEVLGAEPGVDDDFFAAGGQSILAADLARRIRDRFEIPLSVHTLFDAPTVATLAVAVEKALLEELS